MSDPSTLYLVHGEYETQSMKLYSVDLRDQIPALVLSPIPETLKFSFSKGRSTCVSGNYMFFIGGGSYTSSQKDGTRIYGEKDAFVLDTCSMSCSALPELLVPRYKPKVVVCGGTIFVLGGAKEFVYCAHIYHRIGGEFPEEIDRSLFSTPDDAWGEYFDWSTYSWIAIDFPPVPNFNRFITHPHNQLELLSCVVHPDQTKILCCCEAYGGFFLVYNTISKEWETSIDISEGEQPSYEIGDHNGPTGLLAARNRVYLFYELKHLYVYDFDNTSAGQVLVEDFALPKRVTFNCNLFVTNNGVDGFRLLWSPKCNRDTMATVNSVVFKVRRSCAGNGIHVYHAKVSSRIESYYLEHGYGGDLIANCQIISPGLDCQCVAIHYSGFSGF